MEKRNLLSASRQLFSRPPDEWFESFPALHAFTQQQREKGEERWLPRGDFRPVVHEGQVRIVLKEDDAQEPLLMNNWSFGQVCKLASVSSDTLNKLTPETACRALSETFPKGKKPFQWYTQDTTLRAVHGASYTRLPSATVLDVVAPFTKEGGGDFHAPPKAYSGGTGLYAGEEDAFCFLIDQDGGIEIASEEFFPGFFVFNSEVGKRSVGIQTFWFQRICGNHIVWGCTEVNEIVYRHTGKVEECLTEIQKAIEGLRAKRDARRDAFSTAVKNAMHCVLGNVTLSGDEGDRERERVEEKLKKLGLPALPAREALKDFQRTGRPYTAFNVVDALTRKSQDIAHIGDRTDFDRKVAALLDLAA